VVNRQNISSDVVRISAVPVKFNTAPKTTKLLIMSIMPKFVKKLNWKQSSSSKNLSNLMNACQNPRKRGREPRRKKLHRLKRLSKSLRMKSKLAKMKSKI